MDRRYHPDQTEDGTPPGRSRLARLLRRRGWDWELGAFGERGTFGVAGEVARLEGTALLAEVRG